MTERSTDIDRLWRTYVRRRDQRSRDRLIVHYAPLVRFVASRVASGLPQSVEHGELVSAGMFGLIDAITKFEPERGFKFETYAMARIKGAILDELRAIDWVPRSVRSKARQLERAHQRLEAELHRTPTDEELADALGIELSDLHDLTRQVSMAGLIALDEVMGGGESGEAATLGDLLPSRTAGPTEVIEWQELRHRIAGEIDRLPDREKLVLTLYYYEGMTLAEIGRVLEVTESRICQIHTKAVVHLKALLAAAERDLTALHAHRRSSAD